jgi:hypothetical protein
VSGPSRYPTFLHEVLWCLTAAVLLIRAERRFTRCVTA